MKKIITFLFILHLSFGFLFAQDVSYNQEFLVNTLVDNLQYYPATTHLTNGGFVVCWLTRYFDGSGWGYGYSAQIYDSLGQPVKQEFKINSYFGGYGRPIVKTTDMGFAVYWENYRFQKFDNYGNRVGNEISLRKYGAGIQWHSDFDVLENGNIVLCYTDVDDNHDTYFVIFDNENTRLTANTKINTYTNEDQEFPLICSLKGSNFVAFWHNFDGNKAEIFGQLFTNNGIRIGSEFIVPDYGDNDQGVIEIEALTNGGFILFFYSKYNGILNLYGQKYDDQGTAINSTFKINESTAIAKVKYSDLGDDGLLITWIQNINDDLKFFGQYFDKNNNKRGSRF